MKLFKKFNKKFEEERYDEVDKLIDEIFELSKEFSNEKGEYPRSFHKFKNDIFYLDSARYEIEVTLNRLGKDVKVFYNNKYVPTEKDSGDDGCFANSMGAFIELFENFKGLYKTSTKYDYVVLNKVCDKCAEDLKEIIKILENKEEIARFLNDAYATKEKKKREYKEYLDYVTKEKIINEMHKISKLLETSADVLPGHIEDNNFDYAKMTINYIDDECNKLLSKINTFNTYKTENVEDEEEVIKELISRIDKTKKIKKPLEIDLSLIKMNYKCGQTQDKENFDANMKSIKKQINLIRQIIEYLWDEYKQFI